MGGNDNDFAMSVVTDASGVYIYGESASLTGLATAGSFQEFNMGGAYDLFIDRLDLNGNIAWGTYYGSGGAEYAGKAQSICNGSASNVYIAGSTNDYNSLATLGVYQTVNNATNNYYNGLVAKFNGCTALAHPTITGLSPVCANSANTYTVANVPAATTYHWIIPAGWAGASTTNSITTTSTTTSGFIYVYASDGCANSTVDSLFLQVLDPQVTIAANGPTTFCQGGDVELTDNNNANWFTYTYQWQLNNANIAAATGYDYFATLAGNYRVIMTANNQCHDTSNVITLTVNTTPPASITAGGPTTFCTGGNVVLSTPTGPGYSYQWWKDNLVIPSATSSTYTATASGDYTVVTALSGCKDTSIAETVTVEPGPPAPLAGISGLTSLCANMGTFTYSTNYAPDIDNYTWTLPTGWTGSSTTETISVSTGTASGNVSVTGNNACGSTNALSLYVNVTYANPVTSITGNVISTTTTFDAYQWYYNGSPITGATSQSYTMSQFGNYKVQVTKNNCVAMSAEVAWPPLGVNSVNGNERASIYPNPNDGNFRLYGNVSTNENEANISITDIAGRVIMEEVAPVKGGVIDQQISLTSDMPAGMYFLKVKTAQSSKVMQFTKQ
jgi:hypothetical protein